MIKYIDELADIVVDKIPDLLPRFEALADAASNLQENASAELERMDAWEKTKAAAKIVSLVSSVPQVVAKCKKILTDMVEDITELKATVESLKDLKPLAEAGKKCREGKMSSARDCYWFIYEKDK